MNDTQLDQIVRDFGGDILRFCRITAGEREEGDELYQDTMLKLLEKQETLDEGQNIKSYALAIAIKLWQNKRRKLLRRLHLAPQQSLEELMELGGPQTETAASAEEVVLRAGQTAQVRAVVGALPEKYRVPIYLSYSAGLTVKEISVAMKLPENTVKSRLHRGKDMIRQNLEETGYDR